MGEVLAAMFIVFCLVGIAIAIALLTTREQRDRMRTGAEDPRARGIRHNHQSLVLWVNNILHDDMVYPVIDKAKREQAQRLLDEYYDEGV